MAINSMGSRYLADLQWRICQAVNIYVYRNGIENSTPTLVHIPPAQKRNMRTVLAVVNDRLKFPVGYAAVLYQMDGKRIRHPCELQMYHNYVVATNFEKVFKCVNYGRCRSPLIVLNTYSKHVRVLKMMRDQYNEWLARKRVAANGDERPGFDDDDDYPSGYTFPPRAMPRATTKQGTFGLSCTMPPKGGNKQSGKNKTTKAGEKIQQYQQQPFDERLNSSTKLASSKAAAAGAPPNYVPPRTYVVNTCLIDHNTTKALSDAHRMEPPLPLNPPPFILKDMTVPPKRHKRKYRRTTTVRKPLLELTPLQKDEQQQQQQQQMQSQQKFYFTTDPKPKLPSHCGTQTVFDEEDPADYPPIPSQTCPQLFKLDSSQNYPLLGPSPLFVQLQHPFQMEQQQKYPFQIEQSPFQMRRHQIYSEIHTSSLNNNNNNNNNNMAPIQKLDMQMAQQQQLCPPPIPPRRLRFDYALEEMEPSTYNPIIQQQQQHQRPPQQPCPPPIPPRRRRYPTELQTAAAAAAAESYGPTTNSIGTQFGDDEADELV